MDNAEKQMASSNEKDLAIKVPELPPYTIFTRYERLFYAWLGSVAAFASPVSTSIYYPALTILAKDLNAFFILYFYFCFRAAVIVHSSL